MLPIISEYNEKKAKGLTSVIQLKSGDFELHFTRFNPEDGTPFDEVLPVGAGEIDAEIAMLQGKIDELNIFKQDFN